MKNETRELPILFSGPMVLAILEGRKTQTRRIVRRGDVFRFCRGGELNAIERRAIYREPFMWERKNPAHPNMEQLLTCSRYRVGDRLWVKEAWRVGAWKEDGGLIAVDYRADGYCRREWLTIPDDDDGAKFKTLWIESTDDARKALGDRERYEWEPGKSPCRWRAARSMPKWAARPDRLEVTDVRVQRVQEISEADAEAECPTRNAKLNPNSDSWNGLPQIVVPTQLWRDAFAALWESTHGPGAWERNDWVWAYTFRVLTAGRCSAGLETVREEIR